MHVIINFVYAISGNNTSLGCFFFQVVLGWHLGKRSGVLIPVANPPGGSNLLN